MQKVSKIFARLLNICLLCIRNQLLHMNPSLYFKYRSRCGSQDLDFKYREWILKMQQMLQKVSKNFKKFFGMTHEHPPLARLWEAKLRVC